MKIVFTVSAAIALSATAALAGDLTVNPASTDAAALQAGPTLMSDAQMDAVVGAGDPPFSWAPNPRLLSGNENPPTTVVPLGVLPPPFE